MPHVFFDVIDHICVICKSTAAIEETGVEFIVSWLDLQIFVAKIVCAKHLVVGFVGTNSSCLTFRAQLFNSIKVDFNADAAVLLRAEGFQFGFQGREHLYLLDKLSFEDAEVLMGLLNFRDTLAKCRHLVEVERSDC